MACSSSSSPPWRFAVLLTGHASPFTEHKYGGYGRLLVDLLRDGSDSWDIIPVLDDALIPPLPDLDRYHGFVISGSKADAHADDPWILRLCQTLRDLHLRRKKLLGICFGHQVSPLLRLLLPPFVGVAEREM
jgi:GMP synthase-like glutamine amidotransferase